MNTPCQDKGLDHADCEVLRKAISLLVEAAQYPGFAQELDNEQYADLMELTGIEA